MTIAKAVLLVLASLAASDVFAQVNALPPTRHVLVYGEAEARAIPDRFKISISFQSVDADASAARIRVERNMRDVLSKLKASGVAENEIVATSLQIGSSERYDEKTRQDVFVGTEVERTLTARFPELAALKAFLANLKTSREMNVSSVDTELSDEAALRVALRQKSIVSSREKAETIARAYGAKLGPLYSVSDVAPQFQYGIRAGNWPALHEWDSFGGTLDRIEVTGSRVRNSNIESFETGFVTFKDTVYAVFLLAD
jgi:hypothetical protein